MSRTANIDRKTNETHVRLSLELDGSGRADVATGVGFLDHMLTLLAKHAVFDLSVQAEGDLKVDQHHTVEDVGICLGQALKQALGDKAGIRRYGHFTLPMEETLATVAVDLGGRYALVFRADFPSAKSTRSWSRISGKPAPPMRCAICTCSYTTAATAITSAKQSLRQLPAHYEWPWKPIHARPACPAPKVRLRNEQRLSCVCHRSRLTKDSCIRRRHCLPPGGQIH
jgi:hypothetical protein